MSYYFKKLDDGQVPQTKIVSVDISCTLFSLLDLLTFEDGASRLFWNIGGMSYDDLVMQALVWFCIVHLRVIQFAVVQFSALYPNLWQLRIFKHQISGGKNLILHSSKYGISCFFGSNDAVL